MRSIECKEARTQWQVDETASSWLGAPWKCQVLLQKPGEAQTGEEPGFDNMSTVLAMRHLPDNLWDSNVVYPTICGISMLCKEPSW